MELQSEISKACNLKRIGKDERVIVDAFADGTLTARSMGESPEVDGEIYVMGATRADSFLRVLLVVS
jgi:ribosomal protein S12 methylthiotransferase